MATQQMPISIAIVRHQAGWRVISDAGAMGSYAYQVDAEEAPLGSPALPKAPDGQSKCCYSKRMESCVRSLDEQVRG
ncbi:hypothetical protein [Phenylobacterium sp.]|uniref:hypothetical protein n=1 Tax=Phenylobacterium sp. TaxID=1871053 RepID=UPI0035C854FD